MSSAVRAWAAAGAARGWRRLALAGSVMLALLATPLAASAEAGPAWSTLSPAQQAALAPLQREWAGINADRKAKWLEVAGRLPELAPAERQRIQARMADWARMSPAERSRARLQFQETRQQLGPEDRQARWQAYQSLSDEERRKLVQRARPPARPASAPAAPLAPVAASGAKQNLVQAPGTPPRRRVVAPTVVQARPGASTLLMSTPAAPPAHQQAGLPKIAATEGFVDPQTLLPRRGPQGAAVSRRPASAPAGAQ